jgi:hypothetical protein
MAVLWIPGQDVDFLERLTRVEKRLSAHAEKRGALTNDELEAENEELRIRIDSLEEDVIRLVNLVEKISDILGCKPDEMRGKLPEFGEVMKAERMKGIVRMSRSDVS